MFIRRCFQREPIISTVVTAGTVNILLGMAEGQAFLAFLGVLVVSGTLAGRGWHKYRYPLDLPETTTVRYLPEQSTQTPLPLIQLSTRHDAENEH